MLKATNIEKKSCSLRAVNKIYVRSGYEIKEAYKELVNKFYKEQFEEKDFNKANQSAEVTDTTLSPTSFTLCTGDQQLRRGLHKGQVNACCGCRTAG